MPALLLVGSRLCQGAAPGHQRGDVLEQQRQEPGCDGGCIAQQVGSHKRAQDRGDGYVRVPYFPGGPKRAVCGGPRHGRRRGRHGHDHGRWEGEEGSLIRGRVLQRERSSRLRDVGSCAGGRGEMAPCVAMGAPRPRNQGRSGDAVSRLDVQSHVDRVVFLRVCLA